MKLKCYKDITYFNIFFFNSYPLRLRSVTFTQKLQMIFSKAFKRSARVSKTYPDMKVFLTFKNFNFDKFSK